jgi:SAM-dependent methyltransferase
MSISVSPFEISCALGGLNEIDTIRPMDIYADPLLYDLFNPGPDGDIAHYRALASACDGPVLELGTGTGRVSIALARAGHTVFGVDRDPLLLSRCRQKLDEEPEEIGARVSLFEMDAAELALDRTFELILLPYHMFHHLLEEEERDECLRRIRAHLAPGGTVVFDLFEPTPDVLGIADAPLGPPLRFHSDVIHPETGNRIVLWTCSPRADRERHILQQDWIYEEIDEDGQVIGRQYQELFVRYYERLEFQALLESAEFAEVTCLPDDRSWTPGTGQIWQAGGR